MAGLSINANKLGSNKLWMEINRSLDPAGVVNIEVWNNWKKIITSNPVLAKLQIKSVAQFISRPWPDEMHHETLSDHVSFVNILKHKREIQKTIILSIATVAIGYAGNKPGDYTNAKNAECDTLLHVLGDRPVARLLTDKSWESWRETIAMSRLMSMNVDDLAAYIGIITTPELANVKVSALIKMTFPELKSKYSSFSLDIITLCLSTLSLIIKINVKHDNGASTGSTDLATVILENYDTLREMFAK